MTKEELIESIHKLSKDDFKNIKRMVKELRESQNKVKNKEPIS